MIVVSDTSPIRALAFLELLPLLDELFDGVLVPPAVRDELNSPLPRFETIDLSIYHFIVVQAPLNQGRVQQFLHTLDRGESEAIALALETGTRLILIDEQRGRAAAAHYGIVPLGTLGVLLRAKSRNHMTSIRPHVDKLGELGFFISDDLKDKVLRLAGE